MAEKGQLVSFPTSTTHDKAVYDKMQEFEGSYLVVCEPMVTGDLDFKNLRRIIATCEGLTLYSRITTARKNQRKLQTILSGERRVVMLSKFGQDNMKIDLASGRRAKNEEMEEQLNRYMELMDLEVRPEDVKCDAFFKTHASFHFVAARGYRTLRD